MNQFTKLCLRDNNELLEVFKKDTGQIVRNLEKEQ